MPEGTCFLIEGTIEGNANVFANGRPAAVEIGKPETRLDLVTAGGESKTADDAPDDGDGDAAGGDE